MADYELPVFIGGGEPTLHPDFLFVLAECWKNFHRVVVTTNGSMTKIALYLANKAKDGMFECNLSLDPWHDPIDPVVIEAFTKDKKDDRTDLRGIRDVSKAPGMRPFRNPEDGGKAGDCLCNIIMVAVNGDLRACGCNDAPVIGNVYTGFNQDILAALEAGKYAPSGDCWKQHKELFNKPLDK